MGWVFQPVYIHDATTGTLIPVHDVVVKRGDRVYVSTNPHFVLNSNSKNTFKFEISYVGMLGRSNETTPLEDMAEDHIQLKDVPVLEYVAEAPPEFKDVADEVRVTHGNAPPKGWKEPTLAGRALPAPAEMRALPAP
jgi:hypothetical protein